MLKNKFDVQAPPLMITPNNRLSNQLLRDFMNKTPDKVVDKPPYMPYSVLLRHCFETLQHRFADDRHPILLNAHQTHAIWKQIIGENGHYPYTESLLHQVQEASTRCRLWGIDVLDERFFITPQTRQFQAWDQAFSETLKRLNAMVEAQIIPYCMKFNPAFQFKNIEKIIWVSFDDYTPQQRMFRKVLDDLGYSQQDNDLEEEAPKAKLYTANDPQDELDQLIAWLHSQLDANRSRIGVVVPDLQQQSQALQRRLLRTIPESQFDISLGQSMIDFLLVAHALQWLALSKTTLSQHQVRLLLHSPYLVGAVSEFDARSTLLEACPLLQEANIPFKTVVAALQPVATILANRLDALSDYPLEASPNDWVNHFHTRLTSLGFPGEYPLDSSAYQCLQRFQNLFDDFCQLALVQPKMSRDEALGALQSLTKATIFQIKKAPAPIQIMGLLEASGCEFDAVWVTGLTDQCLPQKVNFNPFIPMSIQREQRMPHALPDRELNLAAQGLNRLQNGSRICLFSYSKLTEDTPNLPSPLVRDLPPFEPPPIPLKTMPRSLIQYQESYINPLSDHETISGGTALLANQAKCPFRAFAAHRLQAKAALKQTTGLNDAERGQVLHKVLEVVWTALGSQHGLLNTSNDALDTLIDDAIGFALTPFILQRANSFPPLIQTIERNRLKRLIEASLQWERQRPPFSIKAIEETFTLTLAGLDFRVRVDRLDSHDTNGTWVIDYKSSLPPHKPWNDERPESPQLLLYALLDNTITSLLFLQLKTGQILCSGISQEKFEINGLSHLKKEETWEGKRAEWQQRLIQLAIEFRDGQCQPLPQRSSTCLSCEFKNLCRI